MRKLFFQRRAVSTIIAGVIILAIFLTAMTTMLVVGQQNGSYRSTMIQMQQNDIDRFSENLVGVYPGLSFCQTGCRTNDGWHYMILPPPPSGFNQYVMNISNYAAIAVRIGRIYISSSSSSGCYPAACVLDPGPDTPTKTSFRMSDSLVNPAEFGHQVVLWVPNTVTLASTTSTISMVTSRGRIFTLQYPFSQLGGGAGQGGTGLNIGPLQIRYETTMLMYSTSSDAPTYPKPIGPPPTGYGTTGGWVVPASTTIMFFIKIYNQGINPVTLLKDSIFQLTAFGDPGTMKQFYIVAPLDSGQCTTVNQLDPYRESIYCGPGASQTPNGNWKPTVIYAYDSSKPYVIPRPTQPGVCCSPPVYVLFAAKFPGGNGGTDNGDKISVSLNSPIPVFFTFLDLVFSYDDGTGPFTYGVTLPFITICVGTPPYPASCPLSEVPP